MEGAARAAARRADENTMLAYRVLSFYGLAMKGQLGPLSDYLLDKPVRRPQTADEMLDQLRKAQMRGAAINIRQMN